MNHFEANTVVELPIYIGGGEGVIAYRTVGQPRMYARVIIQDSGRSPNPIIFIKERDLKLKRVHKLCPSCTCTIDPPALEEEDDEDED